MGKKPRRKNVKINQRGQGHYQIEQSPTESKTTAAQTIEIHNDQSKRNDISKWSRQKDEKNIDELVNSSTEATTRTNETERNSASKYDKSIPSDTEKIDNIMDDDEYVDSKLLDFTTESLLENESYCGDDYLVPNGSTETKQSNKNGYIMNGFANCKAGKDTHEEKRKSIDKDRNKEDDCERDSSDLTDTLFPRHLEYLIFVFTLVFRLWYVSNPLNWWVLHPDEIYQTMEVAHSEVYGYGFRAYEYLPPPDPGWENVTSEIRHYEISKGMYSLRSFLLPKILASVMYASSIVAPDMSPYLIVKLFHVVVTSLLPLTVYKFSLAIHQSRDSALLSAILVCSSTTLKVFGTHTLSNSFIAPVLFYTLVPLTEMLKRKENKQTTKPFSETTKYKEYYHNVHTVLLDNMSAENKMSKPNSNNHKNGTHVRSGHVDREYIIQYITKLDQNGNSLNGRLHAPDHEIKNLEGYVKHGKNDCKNGFCNGKSNYIKSNHTIFQNGRINSAGETIHRQNEKTSIIFSINRCNNPLKNYILGLFLSLCVYMRPDCAILPSLCVVVIKPPVLIDVKRYIVKMKFYLFGFVTGAMIGGYVDHVMYENWFLSPTQWFRFNVWKNESSDVFGTQSLHFYIVKLLDLEPWTSFICLMFILDSIIALKALNSKSYSENQNSVHLMVAIFFILYSLLGHKEYRFFHNAIVLMYIAFAESFSRVIYAVMRLLNNQNVCFKTYFTYLFISFFTTSHIYNFITIRDSSLSMWTYGGKVDTNEINICLDFLRKQDDVNGVYVQHDVYMFGGYTVLHKNVSILARNQHNIFEYSTSDRAYSFDSYGELKSLALFSRISEFISIENSLYLAKTLINNNKYNYAVVPSNNNFIQTGYRKVFNVGKTSVLKRTFIVEEEMKLKKMGDVLPIGRNSTVLEYEGYWLLRFGLYAKAERRLLISNRLNPKRLGPFQLLRNLFHRLGNTADLENVLKSCEQVHTRELCNGRYIPFELD